MSDLVTTCPYCGVGCGVSVGASAGTSMPILQASATHPANLGRLCSKGSALGETLFDAKQENRLLAPTVSGEPVGWDDATSTIAERIQQSVSEHGKESVAFYLSGQLLTEDYYVANKLMKGYLGTANVDTNSRLCMSSAVAAYKRAFGSDTVPCSYQDLDCAELILLIGSNAAWTHPVLYQRMVAAKQANPELKIVLIDPRKTASNDIADMHLQLAPSSDGFLFQGLLNYLIESQSVDKPYIQNHTEGFSEACDVVKGQTIEVVAKKTKLSTSTLTAFFKLFADTAKTISFYSQGINQSATGTDKCNAIINCHLASGKIGYPGAGPFSITGQPNAMGGREVGGLANQLAAHMDFAPDDVDRVKRFWNSPTIATKPGLKAVELFDAIDAGKIKVLWIIATNPAVSLPHSTKVRRALQKCPTVIVSDITRTDTTKFADIILPALGWSEKDGTVTNSERRISRQRKFRQAPGVAKPDWWALSQVAKKLGYDEAFSYQSPRDIFIEHAALSGFENTNTRGFDISGLANLSDQAYDDLTPIQWPVNQRAPNGTERMFEDGRFFTDSNKAQFVSATAKKTDENFVQDYPLLLNTGRLRDQWHTMTRTGLAATLNAHDTLPYVQVHPDDAKQFGLAHHRFASVSSAYGRYIAQVQISNDVTPGQIFTPIHWTDEFAKSAVVSAAVSPVVDQVSGQPESKATAVAIAAYECRQWVRVLTRMPLDYDQFDYWVTSKTPNGRLTLLGIKSELDWQTWATDLFGQESKQTFYTNTVDGSQTLCVSNNDKLELLLFAHPDSAKLPSDVWLSNAFANASVDQLTQLISGEKGGADALVCACFGTSRKTIEATVEGGSQTIEALGATLGCGTKCGSCKPELSAFLNNVE